MVCEALRGVVLLPHGKKSPPHAKNLRTGHHTSVVYVAEAVTRDFIISLSLDHKLRASVLPLGELSGPGCVFQCQWQHHLGEAVLTNYPETDVGKETERLRKSGSHRSKTLKDKLLIRMRTFG